MSDHWDVIRTYIKEDGQEYGSISWQMVLQALRILQQQQFAMPDLLEACQIVIKAAGKVDWFLNGAVGRLGVYLSPSELRTIIAAIAEATGEATCE